MNGEWDTFLRARVGLETEVSVAFRGPVNREELIRLIQNLMITLPDWPAKRELEAGDIVGFREVRHVPIDEQYREQFLGVKL
jgi:hypothetical protein